MPTIVWHTKHLGIPLVIKFFSIRVRLFPQSRAGLSGVRAIDVT